jgi:hypothetical protein
MGPKIFEKVSFLGQIVGAETENDGPTSLRASADALETN